MKYLFTPVLVVLFVLLSVSLSMAGTATIVDDILYIPYTDDPPTIDGDLDAVWNAVTATPMLYHEGVEVTVVQDCVRVYDDHHTSYRVMWDDDYFYLFVHVVDDSLDGSEKTNPWMSDCIEVFFDGDNSKGTSYDGVNDVQWRWVYGEAPGDSGNASNPIGEWVFLPTDFGYNLEVRIGADTLATYFPLQDDQEIGFEISNADRDEGVGQQDVTHWWTYVGTTWSDPSLFGTALLVETDPPVSSVISIPYAQDAPTIDGTFEEAEGWDVANEISLTKAENSIPLDTVLNGWTDHMSSAFTMWDEDYFYLFVKVIDEERDGSEKTNPWMSDCIEVFFDGDNSKGTSYDGVNDVQWRWVYGEAPGDSGNASNPIGEWVFLDTELGYNLEVRIGADTLATYFPLVTDHEIGFEISNADRDEGAGQQDVLHWWTHTGTTWSDPSLFGTAVLTGGPSAIGDDHSMVSDFELGQNYPNPFNPSTTIAYSLNKTEQVKLVVYNLIGQKVTVLADGIKNAGRHEVKFNGANLPSGIYFYKLEAAGQMFTNKMMLIK